MEIYCKKDFILVYLIDFLYNHFIHRKHVLKGTIMKKGIISYGEAFVDFIAQDYSNTQFKRFIGGATLNLAVGVQRLGTPSYYLCKLGQDKISAFIKYELMKAGVNIDFSIVSSHKRISEVYVHLNQQGERYFHSYVNETPDEQLLETELNQELFKKAFLFYCGSGTLFHPIAYKTTLAALELSKKHGTLIAFDPNIRIKRWESEQYCRMAIKTVLPQVDILKLTKSELLFLMETDTVDEGLKKLASYSVPFVWITLGEKGALAVFHGQPYHTEGKKVQAIDTTGAGDAFMAGILHCIHSDGLPSDKNEIIRYTKFGNKLGALAATQKGALTIFNK